MARLTPVSGVGGKGPACFLIETGGVRLLLDLGLGPQPGLLPDVSGVGRVDALVLSHGHNDHAGGLSLHAAVGSPPIWCTDIVARRLPAQVTRHRLPLQGVTDVCGVPVRTGRAGHAPGGVWLHVGCGESLLYMGDHSVESILYAYDQPPAASILIFDGSYGAYDAPITECHRTLARYLDGGPLLLPVPENGRGPEMALHLARAGIRGLRLDGQIRHALLQLADTDAACLVEGIAEELRAVAAAARDIDGPQGVMLASRADATGGATARLIPTWEHDASPAIVFTGYLPPGTPAERLVQNGRAQYLRWNVHPRLSDAADLARRCGARLALPAFGDLKHLERWQAAMPSARITLKQPVDF